MSSRIIEAVNRASKDFHTSTWTQPEDMPLHRQQLTQAVMDGDDEYRHQFTYPEIDLTGYAAAMNTIETMAETDLCGPALKMIRHHLQSCRLRASALTSNNDDDYAAAAVELDGLPSAHLVSEAKEILSPDQPANSTSTPGLDPGALKTRLETALNNYRLEHWHVQISPAMTARMSVNGPLKRLRIREYDHFTEAETDRLLVHEVGGHVLRWENAAHQPEPMASLALGSTVPTEEGLALWSEATAGLLDPNTMRTYAARTITVDMAQTQGIVAITTKLCRYVDLPVAVDIALRVKRGLRNPNNPGGMTKDWGYLGGLRMVEQLSISDPAGLEILRGVKWSMEHIELAKELHADGRINLPELSSDLTKLGIEFASTEQ